MPNSNDELVQSICAQFAEETLSYHDAVYQLMSAGVDSDTAHMYIDEARKHRGR